MSIAPQVTRLTLFVHHERMARLTVDFDSSMMWVSHGAEGYLDSLFCRARHNKLSHKKQQIILLVALIH